MKKLYRRAWFGTMKIHNQDLNIIYRSNGLRLWIHRLKQNHFIDKRAVHDMQVLFFQLEGVGGIKNCGGTVWCCLNWFSYWLDAKASGEDHRAMRRRIIVSALMLGRVNCIFIVCIYCVRWEQVKSKELVKIWIKLMCTRPRPNSVYLVCIICEYRLTNTKPIQLDHRTKH